MTSLPDTQVPEHLEHRIDLPDGRTFAVAEWGDPTGIPSFMISGTPGGRIAWSRDPASYARLGIRRFTFDRPGYGESTRQPGRRISDIVPDIAAVADALSIHRFVVTGRSGGGPHALALAALLPDRVIRCMADVSIAPLGAGGLDQQEWLNGQTEGNVIEFTAALAGEEASRRLLTRLREEILVRVAAGRHDWLGEAYDLSAADVAQLRQDFERDRVNLVSCLAPGVDGWVDDNLAFTRPWGFDVGDIRVPVVVAYGRTDALVPPAHGDWLVAHIPGAEPWIDEEAGHMSSDSATDRKLAWLAQPDGLG